MSIFKVYVNLLGIYSSYKMSLPWAKVTNGSKSPRPRRSSRTHGRVQLEAPGRTEAWYQVACWKGEVSLIISDPLKMDLDTIQYIQYHRFFTNPGFSWLFTIPRFYLFTTLLVFRPPAIQESWFSSGFPLWAQQLANSAVDAQHAFAEPARAYALQHLAIRHMARNGKGGWTLRCCRWPVSTTEKTATSCAADGDCHNGSAREKPMGAGHDGY